LLQSVIANDTYGMITTTLSAISIQIQVVWEAYGESKSSPLHAAAQSGMLNMCVNLLRFGADANCQDKDGNTPMHLAAQNDFHDVVVVLFDSGGDPMITNSVGVDAFAMAVQYNAINVIRALSSRTAKTVVDPTRMQSTPLASDPPFLTLNGPFPPDTPDSTGAGMGKSSHSETDEEATDAEKGDDGVLQPYPGLPDLYPFDAETLDTLDAFSPSLDELEKSMAVMKQSITWSSEQPMTPLTQVVNTMGTDQSLLGAPGAYPQLVGSERAQKIIQANASTVSGAPRSPFGSGSPLFFPRGPLRSGQTPLDASFHLPIDGRCLCVGKCPDDLFRLHLSISPTLCMV
jgi:hypothetical protein